MLYIVEIPHQFPPTAWTASDKNDFVSRVVESRRRSVVYEKTTIAQLLQNYGLDSLEEARVEEPWIATMADQVGLDGFAYRQGDSDFQIEPIDAFDAHKTHLGADLSALFVFHGTEEAENALKNDAIWVFHRGLTARSALQKKLQSTQEHA